MPSHPQPRVLIIEDDADARANLQDILELDDFHVETAGSVGEALDRDSWDDLRVVILDRKLPDGSAEELLPRLKAKAPHAAIVVVTGFADLDGAITAMRVGADDYLLKPVNPELLRKTLRQHVERLRLEEEKHRSETMFRELVESAGCMIVMLKSDHTIAYFNPFAEELTGFRADEVLGRNYFDALLPAVERERMVAAFARIMSGGSIRNYQSGLLRRDGTRATLLWNARRLEQYAGEPVVLGVGQDITSLQEAQDKALRSERLAVIGQMVAGLAHESRNALQRSQACLEMLEMEIENQPVALDLLARIQKAQDHLHKLFEELRGYVAPIQLDYCECQVSEIWREAWELLGGQRRGRRAELRENARCGDLRCQLDRFRMIQVFRNLLENALAACQDPVEIEVECRDVLHQGRAAVRVAVRDNGPGLTTTQRDRIFEPFFTTKTQGTGLGMAIAQRIVEAHGGQIVVGDEWDRGAELVVTIPRTQL